MKPFYIGKDLTRLELLDFIREFANELYGNYGNRRWIDDTPSNSIQIPFLFELFPNAKYINIVRHPYDVADSTLNQLCSKENTFEEALKSIQYHHKYSEELKSKFKKENVLTLKLEDLVDDPTFIQKKLSNFLDSELNLNHKLINEN